MKLILGSGSESRLNLLKSINITPDIIFSPSVNEEVDKKTKIKEAVYQIAKRKIERVKEEFPNDLIICADSLAYCKGRIIGKPKDAKQAKEYLQIFSGRKNKLFTCVFVHDPSKQTRYRIVSTTLKFKVLSEKEIENYILSDNWKGKCAGYTLEGLSGKFIKEIQGSYSNVLGLPLYETVCLINNPKLTD